MVNNISVDYSICHRNICNIFTAMRIIVKFNNWECYINPGFYGNGRKAMELISDDEYEESIATCTVNLPDVETEPDEVFIKDYSKNEGMIDCLIDNNVIKYEPVQTVKSGYVEISSYKLTDFAIKNLYES
jgi:hypothetical protein